MASSGCRGKITRRTGRSSPALQHHLPVVLLSAPQAGRSVLSSAPPGRGRREGCHTQLHEVTLFCAEKKVQLVNQNYFSLSPKTSMNKLLTLGFEGGEFALVLKLLTEYRPVASSNQRCRVNSQQQFKRMDVPALQAGTAKGPACPPPDTNPAQPQPSPEAAIGSARLPCSPPPTLPCPATPAQGWTYRSTVQHNSLSGAVSGSVTRASVTLALSRRLLPSRDVPSGGDRGKQKVEKLIPGQPPF